MCAILTIIIVGLTADLELFPASADHQEVYEAQEINRTAKKDMSNTRSNNERAADFQASSRAINVVHQAHREGRSKDDPRLEEVPTMITIVARQSNLPDAWQDPTFGPVRVATHITQLDALAYNKVVNQLHLPLGTFTISVFIPIERISTPMASWNVRWLHVIPNPNQGVTYRALHHTFHHLFIVSASGVGTPLINFTHINLGPPPPPNGPPPPPNGPPPLPPHGPPPSPPNACPPPPPVWCATQRVWTGGAPYAPLSLRRGSGKPHAPSAHPSA